MRLLKRWLGITLGAVALMALPTVPAAANAGYRPLVGAGPSYLTHLVTGCGLPVTVYTPARPGAALPGVPRSFMAQPIAAHARWLPSIKCRAVPIQPETPAGGSATAPTWSGYYDS
jgi:hypothetical protein